MSACPLFNHFIIAMFRYTCILTKGGIYQILEHQNLERQLVIFERFIMFEIMPEVVSNRAVG